MSYNNSHTRPPTLFEPPRQGASENTHHIGVRAQVHAPDLSPPRKGFRIVFPLYKSDFMLRIHFRNQPFHFLYTIFIFCFGRNVWIVVQQRYFKKIRQIFEHIRAARRAARMQQQTRHTPLGRALRYYFIRFFLKIRTIHILACSVDEEKTTNV